MFKGSNFSVPFVVKWTIQVLNKEYLLPIQAAFLESSSTLALLPENKLHVFSSNDQGMGL